MYRYQSFVRICLLKLQDNLSILKMTEPVPHDKLTHIYQYTRHRLPENINTLRFDINIVKSVVVSWVSDPKHFVYLLYYNMFPSTQLTFKYNINATCFDL